MRDMVTNLGGLLMGCYICERKPPKLPAISLRRIRSSVLLVRFAQPAKLRLRAPHSAQNDRLIDCFVVFVRFRRHPSKIRFASWQICFAKIVTALQGLLNSALCILHFFSPLLQFFPACAIIEIQSVSFCQKRRDTV